MSQAVYNVQMPKKGDDDIHLSIVSICRGNVHYNPHKYPIGSETTAHWYSCATYLQRNPTLNQSIYEHHIPKPEGICSVLSQVVVYHLLRLY